MALTFTPQLTTEYRQLFDTCVIKNYSEVDACVDRIVKNKARYDSVGNTIRVPWYFIGILHNMEGSCNFTTHLHNGDPLTARTVQVPKGCPKTGNPPFTWESSAEDALRIKKFDTWTDWTVPGLLFKMEVYNGTGYRSRGIHTPYLWSYSNHYTKGKFVKDGVYDPNAVSKQIGAAVLLRRMSERELAVAGEIDTVTQIKTLGEEVQFNPTTYSETAEQLQVLLNSIGQSLRTDGKAGEKTSNAYQRISGNYLKGDSRRTG